LKGLAFLIFSADPLAGAWTAGGSARFGPQGAIEDFLALIDGECQQFLKTLAHQWLTPK
jgi:hypothetical protein